jgi:hypothetical protein
MASPIVTDFVDELMDNLEHDYLRARIERFWLGGTAGPSGGQGQRPGGYIGKLVQSLVAYDTTEAATLSGQDSLVDNLNHIRYNLANMEFLDLIDTPDSYSGFANNYVIVNDDETGLEFTEVIASDSFPWRVTNKSGAWADNYDIGFISASGVYITTTTASDLGNWVAVVSGGANNGDIYVTNRGRTYIKYNEADGTPNQGSYLVTSSTATKAKTQSYVSPEIFAVCVASGVDGLVDSVLFTQRTFRTVSSDFDLINFAGTSTSSAQWTGTVNDAAPTTSPVTVSTTGGKSIDTITPSANNHLAGTIIWNTTRNTGATLKEVSGSTLIFDTDTELSNWVNGDSLTSVSPTIGSNFRDIKLKNVNTIPQMAVALDLDASYSDSGGVPTTGDVQPWVAFGTGSKAKRITAQVTGITIRKSIIIPLINRIFGFRTSASGSGTATAILRLSGWIEATP